MADNAEYSLGEGQTAQSTYDILTSDRFSVVEMGRKMSELTIPSVIPPEGYKAGDPLPGNNQSLSAMAVNTLASALTFMAFPPGQPILRFRIVEHRLQPQVDNDPALYAQVTLALSRLEMNHRERIQGTTMETAYNAYNRLLLVGGNALWKHVFFNEPTAHPPTDYVVKRNSAGLPLYCIHKECVTWSTLDPDHQQQIREATSDEEWNKDPSTPDWRRTVDIYSVLKLKVSASGEKTWLYWQAYKDVVLEDTGIETDFDAPPMWPGWLIPVYGSDWGRGYCEEYRGDLYTIEALASAVNDGASLAALSLIMVKPGGNTTLKAIREARNLSAIQGAAEDVSVFRTDKTTDFNFVVNHMETVNRRISAVFLMNSSIQRNAERVTAEEIRRLGQELDRALGGLYTQIAQGNQKVIITRAVRLSEEEDDTLPPPPKGIVELQIITGKDALGNSTEFDNLAEYAAAGQQAFPKSFEASHDPTNYFMRLASAKGIKPDGLVKSVEQRQADLQAEQQQAAGMELLSKGTGPAVKGIADALTQQNGQPLAAPTQTPAQ